MVALARPEVHEAMASRSLRESPFCIEAELREFIHEGGVHDHST